MPDFWNNKKVLITGADGFIGSHLVEHLQERGAIIRALVLYNSFNNWGWLENIPGYLNIEVITGDIRDAENCMRMAEGIDIIFHLACLIAVPYSFQAPGSYIDTNINGTFNICQAARSHNCKLIYVSSSEVYGSAKYLPIDENHPLQAQSPYSATKISAEAIVYSFYRSYNLRTVIVRPFNTFGPRQSARAIIPSIIIQIANGIREIRLGNTFPRRDFNYVTDTCNGMALLGENENIIGETINIGSGRDYSVKEIFLLISDFMKKDAEIITDMARIRPGNSEVEHLLCDNNKIKKLTNFIPKVSFEEGLKITIQWFLTHNNITNHKSQIYNV